MTFKEKREEHYREMKWLLDVTLKPIYLFMFTIPILVATNAQEWFFKFAIERLAYGCAIGFVTSITFIILKEQFGYHLYRLPRFLRWKFETLRDWL